MRLFDCTRAGAAGLAVGALLLTASAAAAQTAATANFSIFIRATPIGTEQVTVDRSADGITISSTGRVAAPVDLVVRQFRAKYDANWKPLELTVDATLRGQNSLLKSTVVGGTATTTVTTPAGTSERTDPVTDQSVFLPPPFIAPYEAVSARIHGAAPGTAITLFQPGQGPFTALVGESSTERIQTVERLVVARRTAVTFQVVGAPPIPAEVWSDENGRLLRLRIPSQTLEVAREDMAAVSTRSVTVSRPNDLDVRIPANGFSLAGTISRPATASAEVRLPAVILVAGSGPTNRDEQVFGIPIFGQISNALADAGFLVLRYDKRGVGQSGGRPESATLTDYAEDLKAAVRLLADRKDVDRKRIALVGHSEGGSLALMAAAKNDRVAAVALLSTIGGTGAELNMYQVERAAERAGRPEADRLATIDLQRRIQAAVLTGRGWDGIQIPDAVRRQADTPYFQSVLALDTAKLVKDVNQPLLILQGERDRQIPPDSAEKLAALARARKKAPAPEIVAVPGVNHLLVPAETGEVDEYPRLGSVQVSPSVIDSVTSFLQRSMPAKP